MNQNQYYYQSVPNQIPQTTQPPPKISNINPPLKNQEVIEPYRKTDPQFFNSLPHYAPLCYSGRGTPLFFTNKGWYHNLGCIMIMNALFVLVVLLFLRGAGQRIKLLSPETIRKYCIVNLSLMVAMNIAYFFTQFLNPGIVNLSNISNEQYKKDGKIFCVYCNGYHTQNMEHCKDCDVCIYGLDHHCGFFSKCIGGYQKYAFYAFICIVFLGFFSLIVSMTANIGL